MTDLTHDRIHRSLEEDISPLADWYARSVYQAKVKRATHTKNVCDRISVVNTEPIITVSLDEDLVFQVPDRFKALATEIQKSTWILTSKVDYEEESGTGYSQKTLKKAIQFIISYSKEVWEEQGVIIDAPRILPSGNGTIDLFWETAGYDLLINIHQHPRSTASFYGDNKGSEYIEGNFEISSVKQSIILFLLEASL